jgi:hypothetical protein
MLLAAQQFNKTSGKWVEALYAPNTKYNITPISSTLSVDRSLIDLGLD